MYDVEVMSITEANRLNWSKVCRRVENGKPVVLTRMGDYVAAVVPIEWMERLSVLEAQDSEREELRILAERVIAQHV